MRRLLLASMVLMLGATACTPPRRFANGRALLMIQTAPTVQVSDAPPPTGTRAASMDDEPQNVSGANPGRVAGSPVPTPTPFGSGSSDGGALTAPAVAPAVPPAPPAVPGPADDGRDGAAAPVGAGMTLSLASGFGQTLAAGAAGGGTAAGTTPQTAGFVAIGGLAIAADGTLYVSDPARHVVRRLSAGAPAAPYAGIAGAAGFSGDGSLGALAQLDAPRGLALDGTTGALYVADSGNGRIRQVFANGQVGTLLVTGATPWGVALGSGGDVLFTERGTGDVRRRAADGSVTTLATLTAPGAIALDLANRLAWVADGDRVRVIRAVDGAATLDPAPAFVASGGAGTLAVTGLAYDQQGALYVAQGAADGRSDARVFRVATSASGAPIAGRAPEAVAGSGAGGVAAADFAVPDATVANALQQRYAAGVGCALAIDLHHATDPGVEAGTLYLASGLAGTFGQVARLAPAP